MTKSDTPDTPLRVLLVLGALWIIAYLWSVSILVWSEPTGDSFARGLNKVTGFFGWQFAAGTLGLIIFILGRRLPVGRTRWFSRVPILLALLPFLLVLGVLLYSWTIQAMFPHEYYVPPTLPTAGTPAPTATQ